jgi:hypothetical protein
VNWTWSGVDPEAARAFVLVLVALTLPPVVVLQVRKLWRSFGDQEHSDGCSP